jgi:glycosyltransferase involved in cell wall biosynthesis
VTPQISVVVATHDRPDQLRRCLESLARQNLPRENYEVVVVDDGSPQPPAEIVAAAADRLQIALITQRQAGPGPARNAGVQRARAPWVAFTDDDCEPDRDWLAAMLARLNACGSCVVGGRSVNGLAGNVYSSASQLLINYLYDYFNRDPEHAVFFTSNNMAVPAAPFIESGGFVISRPILAGEDREFCDRWRAQGRKLVYAPEAVVFHSHALTFRQLLRQHYNYGRGAYTFHQLRASRNAGRIRLEPLGFYAGLVARPFKDGEPRPWRLAALFGVIQTANAAGFFFEVARRGRLGRMEAE